MEEKVREGNFNRKGTNTLRKILRLSVFAVILIRFKE